MTSRQSFRLLSPLIRERAKRGIDEVPDGWIVTLSEPKRSLEQNRLLWTKLGQVAEQVEWYGQYLTAQDWKTMFTASLRKARVVPGIDPGSFVVMGLHTSTMTKDELSNLIELINAFAAERGVIFRAEEYE